MLATPAPVGSSGCYNRTGDWSDGQVGYIVDITPSLINSLKPQPKQVVTFEFEGIQREFIYRAALNRSVPAVLVVAFHSYYFDMDFVEDRLTQHSLSFLLSSLNPPIRSH